LCSGEYLIGKEYDRTLFLSRSNADSFDAKTGFARSEDSATQHPRPRSAWKTELAANISPNDGLGNGTRRRNPVRTRYGTDEAALPKCYCRIEARIPGVIWETVLTLLPEELAKTLESSIQEIKPDNDAIKAAVAQNVVVPGAEVRRGTHLRVA